MDSSEGIEALFLYATEGILFTNDKGEITRINPSAERMFGYNAGELLGQKVEVLIPQKFAQRHHHHREGYGHNPHPRSMGGEMELFALKKDGSEFPVEISLSPYQDDRGKFVIAFIIDITIRKMAEERMKNYTGDLEKQVHNRTLILEEAIVELEKTKEDLNNALYKEKELNELKSRFVSMASHEFRTPLATILSSLWLVAEYGEKNDKEKQNRHIERIKTTINSLTDILNDFLSIGKLEEGKVINMAAQFNLKEFVNEIVVEMKMLLLPDQKIQYNHVGIESVMLDIKLLKNILFNLVSNAIKFSGEGDVILINSEVDNSNVIISVKDDGMGISPADQEHLFERFFRGYNASNIQGTGLGLNIVAKYLELMNGSIAVESEEETFQPRRLVRRG